MIVDKSRNIMAILYPDDPDHVKAMDLIKKSYSCAYILHDKDTTENGELKKPHYHVAFKFSNPRSKNALAKKLNVPDNYFGYWDNGKLMFGYLVHFNDPDKYQYSINDVHGILRNKVADIIANRIISEYDALIMIRDYIAGQRNFVKSIDVFNYSIKQGIFKYYKRNYMLFKDLIKDKNDFSR